VVAPALAVRIRSRLPGPFGRGALGQLPARDEIPGARVLDRRLLRLAVPLAVGALALTACGGSSGDGGSGGGGKTYTLAYQGPLSGDNAQLGINMDNGVKLAVEQANAKGDLGFTLKFTNSDDVGDPAQGPTAAQKLIDDASVVAVVGPAFSGATKASEPLFTQANLVSVSPSATNPTLTSQGFKTFFRVVPPDDAQGAEAAAYMEKGLKAKKIYLVDDKSEYGVGLADVIAKSLATKPTREGIPVTKDYSTIAQKVSSSGADVLFYSGYYAELALLAKALKAAGYKGAIVSGDGANDDQLITQAGAANAEGIYLTCPCNDANVDPNATEFTKAYKAKFNTNPGTYSPESYDAANAIIAAMKSIDGDITREKVVEAVRTIDYKGITKQIKFESNGEVSGKTIFVYQVKGGKRAILGTTAELAK
jgi:branched-chain amino acid transport system substrate-binding protein